ncbi:MAG: DUF1304 domain-containing protein [Pirellulales bacterium]|nr:DUF1304 domain-containing protein [Pirellulales bacterium]
MEWYIAAVGVVHALFAGCEMLPWPQPLLLYASLKKLAKSSGVSTKGYRLPHYPSEWTPEQRHLVATVVKNAGIYNAVMAGALFWSAYRGAAAYELACVLLIGVAVAGAFGTATLKSPVTAVQSLLGLGGAVALWGKLFP